MGHYYISRTVDRPFDLVASMECTGNAALKSTAEEVRRLLTNAVEQIGA